MSANIPNHDTKANDIVSFKFNGTTVTAFERNGNAWFVAGEVASALGYEKPTNAVSTHCKAAEICKSPELGLLGIPCNSPRGLTIIPERDLYRLVMRSKLKSAEAFEEKVVSEILPSIRKTGGYIATNENDTPEMIMARALQVADRTIKEKTAQLEIAQPKAEAFDELAGISGDHNIRDSAKQCGWPERPFNQELLTRKWTYISPVSGRKCTYADKIKAGYMTVKNVQIHHKSGEIEGVGQPMITQKGLAKLRLLLGPYPGNSNTPDAPKNKTA